MKKNIGTNLALYPTPLVVVGTMVDGKPNYTLVGHLGIIGHDRIMISLANTHYSNQGIKETHSLSFLGRNTARMGGHWNVSPFYRSPHSKQILVQITIQKEIQCTAYFNALY